MSLGEALLVTRARHGWWQDTVRLCDDGLREWRWRHDSPDVDDIAVTARFAFESFEPAIVAMRTTPAFDIETATTTDLVSVAMRVLAPTGTVEFTPEGRICNEAGVDYVTASALAHITGTDRPAIDKALRRAERAGLVNATPLPRLRASTPWPGGSNNEQIGWIPATVADARTEWANTPGDTLAARGAARIDAVFQANKADHPDRPRRWPVSLGDGPLDREVHAATTAGLITKAGYGWVPAAAAAATTAAIARYDTAEQARHLAERAQRAATQTRLTAWADDTGASTDGLDMMVPAEHAEDTKAAVDAHIAAAEARDAAEAAQKERVEAGLATWATEHQVARTGRYLNVSANVLEALLNAAGAEP